MIDNYENSYRQHSQISSSISQKLMAALPDVLESFKLSHNLKDWNKLETTTYNLMNMTAYTNVPELKKAVFHFQTVLNNDRQLETEAFTVAYKKVIKEAEIVIKNSKN